MKVYITSLHAWSTYANSRGWGWHTQAGRIVSWPGAHFPSTGITSAAGVVPLVWAYKQGIIQPSARLMRQLGI